MCTSHVFLSVSLPSGAARLVLRQPCCRSSRIFWCSSASLPAPPWFWFFRHPSVCAIAFLVVRSHILCLHFVLFSATPAVCTPSCYPATPCVASIDLLFSVRPPAHHRYNQCLSMHAVATLSVSSTFFPVTLCVCPPAAFYMNQDRTCMSRSFYSSEYKVVCGGSGTQARKTPPAHGAQY
jgi:hypothetical protein